MADVAAIEERRIVVAVDESEESIYALQWCLHNLIHSAGEGATARNTLILVYARPPPPVYSPLDGTGYLFSDEVTASIDKYSKDLAVSVMERARNICKDYSNMKVEEKVCVGDARDVICEMAQKLGADLLVMGSHGYGFIKRAFLGSVSDYCARNAKCPVLIVKRPTK
ncbi:universal stress protein A-like protein [Elaeis guineensis]|uniref:Universal stress protein A-like protein n=1 Tax=Elaeis guineensis var. tenera TaxID=51953 RepID=A0A6I9R735_ELAGV|nr:universal stress protein A-like protein [Elaeis guineensis]